MALDYIDLAGSSLDTLLVHIRSCLSVSFLLRYVGKQKTRKHMACLHGQLCSIIYGKGSLDQKVQRIRCREEN